jgi:peptidoglycan/xylan/chitin deacetylase (PgdA/CDA1 family)
VSQLVCFTVDYEPDCPPYRSDTSRGVEEATAPLLALLAAHGVASTFFSTGEVAARHPAAIRAIVDAGHELGCHGHTHRRFDAMGLADARAELAESSAELRRHALVDAFRAPNLAFPDAYLPLLADAGYTLDSSAAKYKMPYWRARLGARLPGVRRSGPGASPPGLLRIPASTTSSVLRLPRAVREAWLARLASPGVLVVHPWEFVDWRHTDLRLDCRFHTGDEAFRRVGAVLRFLAGRGARFVTMREAARQHAAGQRAAGRQATRPVAA